MADCFPNEGRWARRINDGDDRWRCSLCGGFVRGNAPLCKHCHARFGAAEPLPGNEPSDTPEPSEPLTGLQKVAIGIMLVLLLVIGVGCYFLAIRIGGYAGIVTGWLLAPALVMSEFAVVPIMFGERSDKGTAETIHTNLVAWGLLTCIVLPAMVWQLVRFHYPTWWGNPLGIGIMVTLYAVIAANLHRLPWFQDSDPFDALGNWRTSMLHLLAITVLVFIAKQWNAYGLVLLVTIVYLQPGLRAWLWRQSKALWERVRDGVSSARGNREHRKRAAHDGTVHRVPPTTTDRR